ncbi:hypothetical protein [Nocardioides sp.]|uniref:hypothetical protein n=1 Tax=Nocardioides sp. TaxID=35761 RepID=UPI001A2C19C5|nr:hypothetical protein [Nocardioides sp.]MBJ7358553.1 hypothetical protein [Nocardioides sp.]
MTGYRAIPSLVIAMLVAVALGSVAATLVGLHRDPAPRVARESDPPSVDHPRPEVEAAAVLAAWDADRAEAWSAGDVRRLRSLYTPGSVAGERDVAMLRRWLDSGLVVDGLRTQLLALDEVRRSADRWVLSVTDRLVDGVVRGGADRRLPDDAPTTRIVTLRLVGDRWLVSSVR